MDTSVAHLILITTACLCMLQDTVCGQTTDDEKGGSLTGKALIEMGNKLNKPLLRLIGQTLQNVETKMKEISAFNKKEMIDEMCRLHPCSQWSGWTTCDATNRGEFGGQIRNRNCGYNTTLCEYYAETSIEYENRVCENTCPDDYIVTQHGFCLRLYATTKKQRDDAEAVCQSDGGHLINVDSFEKVHDVNATLDVESYFENRVWIDGRRSVQAGPWKYGYKSSDPSFTFWGDNDPDNGVNDLCIMYNREGSTGYLWRKFDYSCTSAYGFICQIIV